MLSHVLLEVLLPQHGNSKPLPSNFLGALHLIKGAVLSLGRELVVIDWGLRPAHTSDVSITTKHFMVAEFFAMYFVLIACFASLLI